MTVRMVTGILGVVRVNRNFLGESSFGLIATDGNAQSSSENTMLGADLRLATSKFKGNKNLSFLAYGLVSETDGITGRGAAWGTELNLPNDRFKFRTGYQAIEEGFVAGVGFVPANRYPQQLSELCFWAAS